MLPDGVTGYPGQMCLYVYRDGTGEAVFSRHEAGVSLLAYVSPPGGRGLTRATLIGLARLYGPIDVEDPSEASNEAVMGFWYDALADGLVVRLKDACGQPLPADPRLMQPRLSIAA